MVQLVSADALAGKSLSSTLGNQQSFVLRNSATFNSIQITYFDNSNCTSLANTVTLNGPAALSPGTYTSTDQSNYALCSKYPSNGCQGLLSDASTSIAGWSMQYTYTYSDGSSYQSVCMNNPNNVAGNYEVEADYSAPSTPVACTSGSGCGFSQAYPALWMGWAVESGATNGGVYAYGIAYDENTSSSVYVVGGTNTALASDLTQAGDVDYFIAKYDANTHAQLWVRQVGASGGHTSGQGVKTDASGNIYLTGYTDVAISGQTLQGSQDYFIAKYDTDGNLLWTRQVGASGGTTEGNSISTSLDGDVYITGATDVGISGQTLQGNQDYFIAKYGTNGNLIWTREVGASGGTTIGSGITVDPTFDKNVYITGSTNQGISGQSLSGDEDYFLAKYTPDGDLVDTKLIGVPGTSSSGLAIKANTKTPSCSYLYVTGDTSSSGDSGIYGQQNGNTDYFIAKYDYSLNSLWGFQVGAPSGDTTGLGVDSDGVCNSYLTGYTTVGLSGQTQIGEENYFIAKYNSDGVLQWGYQAGAFNGLTAGSGISTSAGGNSYITGYSNVGVMGQTLVGSYDYFIASYPGQ
ncbi:MAG: hypothetical protein E6Q32_12820 [Neisseriales bacterium]|nr:MAG: hypothetical protein E6Q32_12820 [Neisseriales bacterium]